MEFGDVGTTVAFTVLIALIAAWFLFRVLQKRGPSATRRSRRGKRASQLLLLGVSGSGKTLFYYKSKDPNGHSLGTHTSMKPNTGSRVLSREEGASSIEVVDVPGHARLRSSMTSYIESAKAVCYFIDSVEFPKIVSDTANYLFDVLVHPHILDGQVPILICCNKQDLVTAKSANAIRTSLELEIQKLRGTRSAMVQETGDDDGNEYADIGIVGKQFSFDDLTTPISFAECSVLKKCGELQEKIVEALLQDNQS